VLVVPFVADVDADVVRIAANSGHSRSRSISRWTMRLVEQLRGELRHLQQCSGQ
jgi:hypothetical protein